MRSASIASAKDRFSIQHMVAARLPLPNTVSHAYLVLWDRFCRRSVMSWSINIGRIAGTAVRIHVTFVLFLGWIFFATYAAAGSDAAFASLIFVVLLFACVLAHEFGHIFTARAFGVTTPDVTLLPIGGVGGVGGGAHKAGAGIVV